MTASGDASARALQAGMEVLEELCEERIFAIGAQLAVSVDGAEPHCGTVGSQLADRPLRTGHLFNVWCASKPVAAVMLVDLVERAGLSLADDATTAQSRHRATPGLTFAALLNHSAGLRHPELISANLMPYRDAVAAARRSRPAPPFEVFSEFSAAVIACDLIEALSGTDIATATERFLADNGLHQDIAFGVPDTKLEQPLEHLGFYILDPQDLARPMYCDAIAAMAQDNRHVLGAYANARGLCRFYTGLGLVLTGTPQPGFPSPEFLRDALRRHRRARAWDDVLGKECAFSAGFMTGLADHGYGAAVSADAVGHTGLMGSPFGFYDPSNRLAAAGILNVMSTHSHDCGYWRSRLVDTIARHATSTPGASPAPV